MAGTVPLQNAEPMRVPVNGLASLAGVAGFGAVTSAAACCVLPVALASIGVGTGVAGGFAPLASVRTPLLVISALMLAAAWFTWWRGRVPACSPSTVCATSARPGRPVAILVIATALVGLAGGFPLIEPSLMAWFS